MTIANQRLKEVDAFVHAVSVTFAAFVHNMLQIEQMCPLPDLRKKISDKSDVWTQDLKAGTDALEKVGVKDVFDLPPARYAEFMIQYFERNRRVLKLACESADDVHERLIGLAKMDWYDAGGAK